MKIRGNMLFKKLVVALCMLFVSVFNELKSQGSPSVAIALNEYCVSNNGVVDSYGANSDWVEIANVWTNSVSLSGYYLSNDKNNLYKWAFPSSFKIPAGGFGVVRLTGKNTYTNGEYHANFNIQQCKDQWLILTTSAGVIRDSVFVQKTQLGHSRVRMNYSTSGINNWRISTLNTYSLTNPPLANTYKDYMPTPTYTNPNGPIPAGIYSPGQIQNDEINILVNGQPADSTGNCFEVWYTLDGSYPLQGAGTSIVYSPSVQVQMLGTTIIRAVTYMRSTNPTLASPTLVPACSDVYLPSFCETNTYFYDQEYTQITPEFGLVSIAMHTTEANWFTSGGTLPSNSPTIHVEYFDNVLRKPQVTEGFAKIYRPINESWRTQQKGIYITMDDRMGFGCDFSSSNSQIFNVAGLGASTRSVFPTLHLKAGDFESNSLLNSPSTATVFGTGIRDVFYQSLAAKNNLHVNPLHIKPVIAFINGKYQGVYDLREVFDQHYEAFYNNQAKDSVDLNLVNLCGLEGNPTNGDGSPHQQFSPLSSFCSDVYSIATTKPMQNLTWYNKLMDKLDKESFIDYFILGTYATNLDFWKDNVAFGRGNQVGKPGTKWHYYLWNMPTIFNFTVAGASCGSITTPFLPNVAYPCSNMYSSPLYPSSTSATTIPTPLCYNGQGNIMYYLMKTNDPTGLACGSFQLQYKNRYQDLLNGPLRCDNILAHFDYVSNLYKKEMHNHSDPAYTPTMSPYSSPLPDTWDSSMVQLRRIIAFRCDYMINGLKKCYPLVGPYPITVDVEPAGAGSVKLNTMVLPYYKWSGNYFQTTLSFKAIPTNTNYAFHHWEFKVHQPRNNDPLSKDSVAIDFVQSGQVNEEVVAVFTDITSDISQNGETANMPSAFSPNGDNVNDTYKPLGSGRFVNSYDFRIYNRWGQEVFRSTDPALGWDGTFEGQQSVTGVYAWVITYKNVFNESKIAKGNVTLVR